MSAAATTPRSALDGPARLAGVDLARGLAILGMFAAHLLVTGEWSWRDPSSWLAIVDGRSSILFATLAGVSLGIVSGGPTPVVGPSLYGRLVIRAGVLWVLGLVLIITGVPVHVILPAYAVLFLLAIPALRLRVATLWWIVAVVGLVATALLPVLDSLARRSLEFVVFTGWAYPFPVWIVFVLAGLAAARSDLRRTQTQLGLLAGGAIAAAVGYGAMALPASGSYLGLVWTAAPHSSGFGEVLGSGGFALAVLGACLLLCDTAPGRPSVAARVLWPLRATGSMPLTAYVLQLLVWAVAASLLLDSVGDLAGFRALGPFWPITLGVVAFCCAWAWLVGRGPLEYLMDRLARLGR